MSCKLVATLILETDDDVQMQTAARKLKAHCESVASAVSYKVSWKVEGGKSNPAPHIIRPNDPMSQKLVIPKRILPS